VGFFTPAGNEFVQVQVFRTATGHFLSYNVFDFGGGFSAGGAGSIPASSVNVSGGSVNTGNVTVTLNVNTCDVTGFATDHCGTFDITWVEMPASVGGSFATRGDSRETLPGGGTIVTNGQTETFFALATGTALGFDLPRPTVGHPRQTNERYGDHYGPVGARSQLNTEMKHPPLLLGNRLIQRILSERTGREHSSQQSC